MPLLGFQARFAEAVTAGVTSAHAHVRPGDWDATKVKRQTIRAFRKDHRDPKPGDTLHLWTGLRQKGARKLGEVTCLSAGGVTIDTLGTIETEVEAGEFYALGPDEEQAFAQADGFAHHPALVAWFEKAHGLPFSGLLIRW
jgi:hypothetical protein